MKGVHRTQSHYNSNLFHIENMSDTQNYVYELYSIPCWPQIDTANRFAIEKLQFNREFAAANFRLHSASTHY